MAASKVGDLSPAVDLILQPLLLEALVAIDSGKALEDALPADTDATLLDAAVQRLTRIRAIQPSPAGPFGRHTLTTRGRELIRLLEDLDGLLPRHQAADHHSPRDE
jgi:hypothetical protein